REGAHVIASDINEALLAGLEKDGIAKTMKVDALSNASVAEAAKAVGGVDILFNAAGFVHHGAALDCTEKEWDFAFDLNVKSMHRTITSFL
ncbi:SDR family oxidoreductase, partial [Salmonella enterica]|uniref:SDR family oxidoreductase n=1 Tax=Salmonella enterica TaxID=28901 RepID=UPI003D2E82B9